MCESHLRFCCYFLANLIVDNNYNCIIILIIILSSVVFDKLLCDGVLSKIHCIVENIFATPIHPVVVGCFCTVIIELFSQYIVFRLHCGGML